jgi:hypothetical protein
MDDINLFIVVIIKAVEIPIIINDVIAGVSSLHVFVSPVDSL